jgi:hypothetical protein
MLSGGFGSINLTRADFQLVSRWLTDSMDGILQFGAK